MEAIMCPQCNAPLLPPKFARFVVCSYCGATVQLDESSVSAEIFHKAFQLWNSPETYRISSWFSIGNSHWVLDKYIANGDISDVYAGQRARWPTELAVIKLLRDLQGVALFENVWEVLQRLQRSEAPGFDIFTTLIPQPILHGEITGGSNTGQRVNIYRWASGFRYNFEEVLQAYPQGISPKASVWVWRRILEILSFLHHSGIAHGAILPSHLLVQENDHGVRLVGYSAAGPFGKKLANISPRDESFYPKAHSSLTAPLDLIMSARCVITILGGNPKIGSLPRTVPLKLARLIQQIALTNPVDLEKEDAWSIREELGGIAREIFGPPQFNPIVMPA